jgi:F-type H+-transporting ATPase subunit gamma
LIPCTSDRGLCGAIHSTVSKPTKAEVRKNPDSTILAVVGDKCRTQIVREARKNMVMSFNGIGKNIPTFSEAASIAEAILAGKFEFNVGYVLYNRFKSVIAYELAKTPVYTEQAIQSSGMHSFVYLKFINQLKNV